MFPLFIGEFPNSFINIREGEFLMGTTTEQKVILESQGGKVWSDEQPAHLVYVNDYAIGKNLITNADYRAFKNGKGYDLQRYWSGIGWNWKTSDTNNMDLSFLHDDEQTLWLDERTKWNDWLISRPQDLRNAPFWWEQDDWNKPDYPVVGVTWFEAEAFCNWLTEYLHNKSIVKKSIVCRLPTEAEWEKAAKYRAIKESLLWPWGNKWDSRKCNSKESGIGKTTPVGLYNEGSENDINDLIGNVWEWCQDWWDETIYSQKDRVNPKGPLEGIAKVKRGGSWSSDFSNSRSNCRDREMPQGFFTYVGFRVVLYENK